jgi:hypothetical protein
MVDMMMADAMDTGRWILSSYACLPLEGAVK